MHGLRYTGHFHAKAQKVRSFGEKLDQMTNWGDVFEASRERGKSSDELVADFTGTDEGKSGAFCQPPLLAAFVAMLAGTGSEAMTAAADFETATAVEQAGKGAEGGLAKQICRTWLKYTFLGLGKECTVGDDACPRKHSLPANLNLLYKDYSFKGLAPQQRKKIIVKAKEDGCEAGEQQNEAAVEVSGGGDKRKREEREPEEEGVDAEEKTEKKKRKEAKRDRKEKSEKDEEEEESKKKSKKKSKKDKRKRESE